MCGVHVALGLGRPGPSFPVPTCLSLTMIAEAPLLLIGRDASLDLQVRGGLQGAVVEVTAGPGPLTQVSAGQRLTTFKLWEKQEQGFKTERVYCTLTKCRPVFLYNLELGQELPAVQARWLQVEHCKLARWKGPGQIAPRGPGTFCGFL